MLNLFFQITISNAKLLRTESLGGRIRVDWTLGKERERSVSRLLLNRMILIFFLLVWLTHLDRQVCGLMALRGSRFRNPKPRCTPAGVTLRFQHLRQAAGSVWPRRQTQRTTEEELEGGSREERRRRDRRGREGGRVGWLGKVSGHRMADVSFALPDQEQFREGCTCVCAEAQSCAGVRCSLRGGYYQST